MRAKDIRKGLLRQATVTTDEGEISTDDPLEITLGHVAMVLIHYLTVYRLTSSVLCSDGGAFEDRLPE